jgi:hypothetical protein
MEKSWRDRTTDAWAVEAVADVEKEEEGVAAVVAAEAWRASARRAWLIIAAVKNVALTRN